MKSLGILMILATVLLSGCGTPREVDAREKEDSAYIGSAEMKADGTIILQLRAELPDGVGDGYFVYPPTHPEYQNILRHVAPLKPGHSTPVRPWPENKTEPNQRLQTMRFKLPMNSIAQTPHV